MRNSLFYSGLLGLLIPCTSLAQNQPAPADTTGQHYTYQETMPVFPGGQETLFKLLTKGLQYPPKALRDGVQGKVYLSFVVEPTGDVADIKVKQGVRADLDEEALRMAQRLKTVRWQPGTQNQRPVSVVYTVPLTFSLTKGPLTLAADSLDANPGPAIVLPSRLWTAAEKTIPADKGVLYGNCIQRLGFSSGGLPQYVRVLNLTTGKFYRILVKPAMRSRSENGFCVALPPGRYALQWYEYSYGLDALRKAGQGRLTDTRYCFTLQPGQMHYAGKWDFSQPDAPRFLNEKVQLDAHFSAETKALYEGAVISLPQ
ncbi:energy transducer TonB [Microvirga sp. STR05]|uniref:Energy transducer TonB n=1 Tax=Hymenobacter duratus TaxID=2771356 RepID=A0ABR8JJD5_9BACT|nr:energy transducer TonB [Hymenobacter duratus]MBD2715487.1 energy transducer TonB [Hymenobacter duratus]MBR7950395.1 energy transducer TonB [Microvirga sp. STR05]